MELWLTLIALYAWQCTVSLRTAGAVFGPRWLGGDDLRRQGVLLLSPWPSRLGVTASRLPFGLSNDGGSLVFEATNAGDGTRAVSLADAKLDVEGPKLRADGRRLLHAASKAQARLWLHVATELARSEPGARADRGRAVLARTLEVETLRARLAAARHETRWLALVCDVDALFLFLLVPLVGGAFGSEFALTLCAPLLGLLHVLALLLAVVAHRRLFPERRGERFEELFTAALYPPALLRRPQAWVDAATVGFHPLAWVRVLDDDGEDARRIWLREQAWLEGRARRVDADAARYRAELDALAAATPPAWRDDAARTRVDPTAESYCPVCWDDFRPGFDRCATCDAATVRYVPTSPRAEAPPPTPSRPGGQAPTPAAST